MFVPRFTKAQPMAMLALRSLDDYARLPTVKWGNIRQPPANDVADRTNAMDVGDLHLVIMPGVAFTRDGHRLGHGAGYYDKFLRAYKTCFGAYPPTIALALEQQMEPVVPYCNETDVQVDEVIYDHKDD